LTCGVKSYIVASMTTQAQDTHTQDPIERFTLRMEELRRNCVVRGPLRLLHNLFLHFFIKDFFAGMFRLLADLAEKRRNGTLPDIAPVACVPEEARAWPDDLRPRERGGVEKRSLADPWGERTVHEQVEQPETVEPIAEVPQVRVRHVKKSPARPQHVDGGAVVLWTVDDGLLRLDSKKWVLAGLDSCGQFVTI
jgi:hypothetical protein